MTTGDKIRGIRLLKGYSQENLAEMLKISLRAYGDIERGKTDISDSRLQQIAEQLEVSALDILSFGERVNNFFDQCNGAIGVNHGVQNHNYDTTVQQLEIERLKLEVEKLKLEKDKMELELRYFKDKNSIN
ncbi:helix-turn-helix domain-containing protein [Emticicia fontis]